MNEWFKKVLAQIKGFWSKWKLSQKIIFFAIIAVVIVALGLVIGLSTKSTDVVLFNVASTQEKTDKMIMCLAQENIDARVNSAGMITVKDKATADRAKGILLQAGLCDDFDPWVLFDTEKWSTTDFERDVNLQRAIQSELKHLIESYPDVVNANVIISMPKKTIYTAIQEPVRVSVIISVKPGSDFAQNKKSIKGLQKIILNAISGLKEENLAISDTQGNILNDFEGLKDIERIDVIKKEQRTIAESQEKLREEILKSLQEVYTADRVRDLNVYIEMDMSEFEENKTEYTPVVFNEDNPDTPYDDSKKVDSITISSEEINKEWQGVGITPGGPAGVEGQTAPVYADMQNLRTISKESSIKKNEAVNSTQTYRKAHPQTGRTTVSVAIDGTWKIMTDEDGNEIIKNGKREREFIEVTDKDIEDVKGLIRGAIGYQKNRGDLIEVVGVKIDRTEQHNAEDAELIRKQNMKKTIFFVLVGVVAVLGAFLLIRFIVKTLERKRIQREEEIRRQQQLEREKVIWNAEQADVQVTMSVEDRHKAELQDSAIAAAKDHPEDVAQLIRTWLTEE